MVRAEFENKLRELHGDIIEMGGCVEAAIRDSIRAFTSHDVDLCKAIIQNDEVIDEMEKQIESKCLWMIAREQPIASDLRNITTALKITTDMERIGDHAEDIADVAMRLADKNAFADSSHIPQMAAAAVEMVHSALEAYVNCDLALAKSTEEKDDIVDDLFNVIKEELVQIFSSEPQHIDSAIDFLMIAKYLERIADHAVNICEWVHFSKTGVHKNRQIF